MTKGYEGRHYVEVALAYTTDESSVVQYLLDTPVLCADQSLSSKFHNGLIHEEKQAGKMEEAKCHD